MPTPTPQVLGLVPIDQDVLTTAAGTEYRKILILVKLPIAAHIVQVNHRQTPIYLGRDPPDIVVPVGRSLQHPVSGAHIVCFVANLPGHLAGVGCSKILRKPYRRFTAKITAQVGEIGAHQQTYILVDIPQRGNSAGKIFLRRIVIELLRYRIDHKAVPPAAAERRSQGVCVTDRYIDYSIGLSGPMITDGDIYRPLEFMDGIFGDNIDHTRG